MCDLNRFVCKYIHPVDVTHTNIVCMYLAVWYVDTYIYIDPPYGFVYGNTYIRCMWLKH